jgi:phage virion morphogenesis protein
MTTITIESTAVQQQLARLQGNATNLHAAFDAIGEMIRSNVFCFEHEKSPDGINWKALSPSTIRQKNKKHSGGNHKILQDKGKLRNSIAFHATNSFTEITTDTEYAGFHQFGTSKLTPRPFFPNQTLPQRWEHDVLEILN